MTHRPRWMGIAAALTAALFPPVGKLTAASAVSPDGTSDRAVAPAIERPAASCDAARFKIAIDVGHTVEAPGATSARGVTEYVYNLSLAKLI